MRRPIWVVEALSPRSACQADSADDCFINGRRLVALGRLMTVEFPVWVEKTDGLAA
jgi:hypothetical protein